MGGRMEEPHPLEALQRKLAVPASEYLAAAVDATQKLPNQAAQVGLALGVVNCIGLRSIAAATGAGLLTADTWRSWFETFLGQLSEQASLAMGKRVSFRIVEGE